MLACISGCDTQDHQDAQTNQPAKPQEAGALVEQSRVEQSSRQLSAQALPGGETTFIEFDPLSGSSAEIFSQPAGNLNSQLRSQFVVGNSFFTNPWVAAPASTAARDGLGPLFNAAACQDCHIRDGRGHSPAGPEQALTAAVVRISLIDGSADPIYGTHIQTRSLPGLPAEAKVSVSWRYHNETLPDGTVVELRQPDVDMKDWGYGAPSKDLQTSLRVAPAMIGMGLLEAIPPADIQHYAAQQLSLGLRGIVPWLNQPNAALEQEAVLGRFGWKATQPDVKHQSLDAFVNDIGITSSLFPEEPCTTQQNALGCTDYPSGGEGGGPELRLVIENALLVYARHLAPPARRHAEDAAVRQGQAVFNRIGCAGCHKPSWRTASHGLGQAASAALANQLIWPYTDMLLHDMGPGLADGVPEHRATSQHWRTTPLWGLGHVKSVGNEHTGYLHDGRARTLVEAILWHGGEAEAARRAWAMLPKQERQLLLGFLQSL